MDTATTSKLNAKFGLGDPEDGVAGEVVVDDDGWIQFGSRTLTQSEAVDIAEKLLTATMASQWRGQIDEVWFTDTEAILRRQNGKLGQAIHAARNAL
jgi:hypothetical protein